MNSGGKGGAAARTRVSIPSSVKKTIENIKEITGHNLGEDEIYAMLKECSMDPNETAQKLLLLDAFHEVKKRRDRRRENLNKVPAQSRWIQGSQAQMNRVGRGNFSSRPLFHDAGGGTNSSAVKENVLNHVLEKVVDNATVRNTQKIINNKASSVSSPITDISNCPSGVTSQSTNSKKDNNAWASGSINKFNRTKNGSVCKSEESLPLPPPVYSNKNMGAPGPRDAQQNEMLDSSVSSISLSSLSASGSPFISLDPLPSPSEDFPLHSAVDSIRSEVGTNHILVEQNSDNHSERNMVSIVPQKTPSNFSGVEKEQHLATMQTALSRPSSDDNIQPQVIVPLPQKVIPGNEWKPKSTNPSIGQATSTAVSFEGSAISIGSQPESQQTPLEKATAELQRKLEELHASNTQQVVLPNHIHVPEAGKVGFCFGSFDASFGLELTQDGHGCDKSTPVSESSDICEPTEVLQLSNPAVPVAGGDAEIIYLDHTPSLSQQPEESSREAEVLSSDTYDYVESKQEVSPQGHEHPVMRISSSYNYGYVPPMLNGQLRPSEVSESQAPGILPGFLMQQPFDPMSYYAQFCRSGMVSDGCSLPLNSANKYNGNIGLISAQTSQSPQEDNAPLVMSTASAAVPLLTQAVGVQSSISANMQHLPVFRQPTGIHLPHYPPFIHYAPYFSPVYVPPHGIHPYFSSGAFPQQPHCGNLYGATANYPIPQNEQGSNTQSSDHIGAPVSYATYSVPPANYTSTPVTEALNSMSNEEVKENHMCASEQQIKDAGVCQGQTAFASTQPALGTYTGVFHPAHTMTAATVHPLFLQQSQPINVPIDMMGPTAGVYPPQLQQQSTQLLNWPSNY